MARDASPPDGGDRIRIPGDLLLTFTNKTVVLSRTGGDGAEIEHRVTINGSATAKVRIEGDVVVIIDPDVTKLSRRVETTVDGRPVPVPEEMQGLGDLLHGQFRVRCAMGSGGMFATTTDSSGLTFSWAVVR